MTSQVKQPNIQMQGIYAGKFKDWSPSLAPVSVLSDSLTVLTLNETMR
jgi:hypothetical protein